MNRNGNIGILFIRSLLVGLLDRVLNVSFRLVRTQFIQNLADFTVLDDYSLGVIEPSSI